MAVSFGTAADEAALISAISTFASGMGWSTFAAGNPGGNTTWFYSTGESGCHLIVGGLQPAGTRQMIVYSAADLDQYEIVAVGVQGYTNNDESNAINAAAKVSTATITSQWVSRSLGEEFTYLLAGSLDAIVCLCTYTTGSGVGQGILYIGNTLPQYVPLYQYACAKIAAIDASTPATTVVTLDRNINNALKDPADWVDDPHDQQLLFQSVATDGMAVTDFALLQRIPIISGSLTTFGGNTRFSIDATASGGTGKLVGVTGGTNTRYRDGRGVGDLVRVHAQPNVAVGWATATGATPAAGGHGQICAWDAVGGQKGNTTTGQIDVFLSDVHAAVASDNDPAVERDRFVAYASYATVLDVVTTTLIDTSDVRGRKNVGTLRHIVRTSQGTSTQAPAFSMIILDKQDNLRYRGLGLEASAADGLNGSWQGESTSRKHVMIGPGW